MKRRILMIAFALSSLVSPLPSQAQDELALRQLRASWLEGFVVSNRAGWHVAVSAVGVSWEQDPITYLFGPGGYRRDITQLLKNGSATSGTSSGAPSQWLSPVGIEGSGALIIVTRASSAEGQSETTVSRLALNSTSPEKLFSLSKMRYLSTAVNNAGDLVIVGAVSQDAGAPIVKAYQFVRGKLSEVFISQLASGQESLLASSVIDEAGNVFLSVESRSRRDFFKKERLYAVGSTSQGVLTALSGATRRRLNSLNAEPIGLSGGILSMRTNRGALMADVTAPARSIGRIAGRQGGDSDVVQNARGGVTFLSEQPFRRPIVIREVAPGEAPRSYVCRGLRKLASEAGLSVYDLEIQDDTTMFVVGSRQPLPNEKLDRFVKVVYELKRVTRGTPAQTDELARCELSK